VNHIAVPVRATLALALSLALVVGSAGCSAFKPKMQQVTIATVPVGATVIVDGKEVGRSPVTVPLQRNRSHSIAATLGSKTGTRDLNTRLATSGILDIVGAVLFLVPGIGLLTPGAFDLHPNVTVEVR
jgi:hypothetical protein